MTDWRDLDEWDKTPFYFDAEGNRLQSPEKNKVRYTCRVEIEDDVLLPLSDEESKYLKRIIVKVSSKRASIDFSDEAEPGNYRSFSSLSVLTESDRSFGRL